MRPIRLVMQAFGPYAGYQELNMDELGKTGIYAITGETGAGKTTIFDAIVYALYGSGSGEDREDARTLRSAAASSDLETKVELDFLSGGKKYAIVRKPLQRVARKRGDGEWDQPASQVLTLPDGKRINREREIKSLIEKDILGVTKDQFCQIVMIAQGEFRKLLRAGTDERTAILRRIFRTERYNALSQRLEQRCKAQYGQLADARKQVAFSLKSLQVDPASPLREAHEAMQQADTDALLLDGAAELADRVAEADEEACQAACEIVEKSEKEFDRVRQTFEWAKEQAKKRETLTQSRELLKTQQAKLEEAKLCREGAEKEKPKIEVLGGEIATETRLLPKYAQLTELEAKRGEAETQRKNAEADRSNAERQRDDSKETRERLTHEAGRIGDAAERRLDTSNALNRINDRAKALGAIDARLKDQERASTALKQAQTGVDSAMTAEKKDAATLEALKAELEALGNTELTLSELGAEQKTLETAAEENAALNRLYGQLLEAQSKHATAVREYEEKKRTAEALRSEATALRDRFNANLAGVWADALLEGQPCPVCGSTHHPRKAALIGDHVPEGEVKDAEEKAGRAEEARNEQAVTCSSRKEARDGLSRQLEEKLPDVAPEMWTQEIERRGQENATAQAKNEVEIKAAEQADKRARQLRDSVIPAAQKDWEQASKALKGAEQAAGRAEADLSTAKREVQEAARGVLPEGWTALDLSDAMAANDAEKQRAKTALAQAQKDIERLKEIEGLQTEAENGLNRANDAIHAAENRIAGFKAELEGRDREIGALRSELPYPTEADCKASIESKTGQRQALEEAITNAERAVAEWNEKVAETTGGIRQLEAELKDAPEADLAWLEADFRAKDAALKAARTQEKSVHARWENNRRCRTDLLGQAESARALEREYRVMRDVSDTANAKVSGPNKITLETYVQTAYFERIIDYANLRLRHMSRGQYDLARQSVEEGGKQVKKGLLLDVVDHANSTRRAVGTLSGGESFLAALSFALGMSDAIQASKTNAVQLDTMFVDEGFGSLSGNYLDLVMDELNETANIGRRLIGVISHVEDVKDGIDRRIEVTKSECGISWAEIH